MKILRPYQKKALDECITELRKSDDPILLMASVGAGKSVVLAELLLLFEKQNKRALCIVSNAELVRNNAETFTQQGGKPAIYCNALDSKDCSSSVVFGTPQSVLNGIKNHQPIASITFNIIVVDEAHMINYNKPASTFMRILRHYKQNYPSMRVLGATGTAFRYKGEPIVGKECLFKKQVGNITTAWLIENGYLVKPEFEVDENNTIDFSKVKLNSMGKFDQKQLQSVIDKNKRLTGQILTNLKNIMESQKRFGCMIFCSTRRHCYEAFSSLPAHETAIITGETNQQDRMKILDKARRGQMRYLINVQVLTIGVDVPGFDTLLFLRPTESLVLAVQMIGRVLRLHTDKKSALILDCAGNIDRHSDWDDPVILDAIKQTKNKDKPLIFPCPTCQTMNSEHARRCIGFANEKRCDFYFEWKDCHVCNEKADITSRYCPHCEAELIDPNLKLSARPFSSPTIEVDVKQARFWVQEIGQNTQLRASYEYFTPNNTLATTYESFTPTASEKAKNFMYGQLIKDGIENSSSWYPHLQNAVYLRALVKQLQCPSRLKLKWDDSRWRVQKKYYSC